MVSAMASARRRGSSPLASWRSVVLLVALLALLLSPAAVDAKKKKKSKVSKGPRRIKTTSPPEEVCEFCNATIIEISEHVAANKNRMGLENSISDALDVVCSHPSYMKRWKFYPPKMQKGCNLIIENHEERLHEMFYQKKEVKEIFDELCTIECEGVDLTDTAPVKPKVTIHSDSGVKVLDPDGVDLGGRDDDEL
mmetsp:Transcript_44837/g.142789  ORF Transcript_44837/g.142789 Transcript_44837/m.142789 type:complete len:195 (+) Transcript_44837:109-693(+)